MAKIHSAGSYAQYQHSIEQHIESLKKGRREVSNGTYCAIFITMVVIVGCLAFQNAVYGWGQGSTLVAAAVVAVMYFAGDFAFSLLNSIDQSRSTSTTYSTISKCGLFLLSVMAGVSFMLGEQHANDLNSSRVLQLEQQVETTRRLWEQHGEKRTGDRYERAVQELAAERRRVGADHASSNAVYLYLANLTGYSFEAVSFAVRTLWTLIFIITGACLSGLLGTLWTPAKEEKAVKQLINSDCARVKRARAHLTALRERESLVSEWGSLGVGETVTPLPEPQKPSGLVHFRAPLTQRKKRAPTRDTGTRTGKTGTRYAEVKQMIGEGKLKPSSRSLQELGIGTATALKYLQSLEAEGVISRNGQKYQVV